MKKNSISEFELERQDFKIRLKRGSVPGGGVPLVDDNVTTSPTPIPVSSGAGAGATTGAAPSTDLEIKSPMIGTFYRAPSPESANYSEVGTEVGPESVVCIIEAMKVMNEIKAEMKGVITQVLVENGKPVEFGQPLFKLRPI